MRTSTSSRRSAALFLLLWLILPHVSRAADAPRWNILFVFSDD